MWLIDASFLFWPLIGKVGRAGRAASATWRRAVELRPAFSEFAIFLLMEAKRKLWPDRHLPDDHFRVTFALRSSACGRTAEVAAA
jgi:hypothetical protein